MHPEDLKKLVSIEIPFGKHKGRIIADLPGNYLNWFAREGFPPRGDWSFVAADARDRPQRLIRFA